MREFIKLLMEFDFCKGEIEILAMRVMLAGEHFNYETCK